MGVKYNGNETEEEMLKLIEPLAKVSYFSDSFKNSSFNFFIPHYFQFVFYFVFAVGVF